MPAYDYACPVWGPFTTVRPMVEYARPQECPECGEESPRALLQVPGIAVMGAGQRRAHATNERSANAPRLASAHGASCQCCKPKKAAGAAKGFPSQRPWMISH